MRTGNILRRVKAQERTEDLRKKVVSAFLTSEDKKKVRKGKIKSFLK